MHLFTFRPIRVTLAQFKWSRAPAKMYCVTWVMGSIPDQKKIFLSLLTKFLSECEVRRIEVWLAWLTLTS